MCKSFLEEVEKKLSVMRPWLSFRKKTRPTVSKCDTQESRFFENINIYKICIILYLNDSECLIKMLIMLIYFKTDSIINNYSLTSCMITDPLSARDGAASRQQTTRERGYKNNKRNFLHSLNLHPLQDLITCCCKNYFPTNL